MKGTVPRQDGSRFTGMAPGSRKDRGGFRVGAVARAAVVYLVESAIDAISLARLRQMDGENGFAVVSTAGTTPEPRTWFAGLADAVRRVCAFDNDEPGDKAAQALRRHRFERLRPGGQGLERRPTGEKSSGGAGGGSPHGSGGASERSEEAAGTLGRGAAGARLLTFLPFLPFLFRGDSGGRAAEPRGGRQPPFRLVSTSRGNRLFGKIGAERAPWGPGVSPGRRGVAPRIEREEHHIVVFQ